MISRESLWFRLILAAICGWVVIFIARYATAPGVAGDFQAFYAGATADAHGVNPYDWIALRQIEQALYHGGIGLAHNFIQSPIPPPLPLLMRPLLSMDVRAAYRVWMCVLLLASFTGIYLGLANWPRPRRILAGLAIAISPAALVNLWLGQLGPFLLLSLGLALFLLKQEQPFLAGLALVVGLAKPHLMIPIAVITIMAIPSQTRPKVLGGLVSGALATVILTAVTHGGAGPYSQWVSGIREQAVNIRQQPDIASIPGLYFKAAPASVEQILNVLCLMAAAIVGLQLVIMARDQRVGSRFRLLGCGIATFMTATPYVHSSDQIVLALPLLLLIGPHGEGLTYKSVWLALAAFLLEPAIIMENFNWEGFSLLPSLFLAIACSRVDLSRYAIPSRVGNTADLAVVPKRREHGNSAPGAS